MVQMHAYPEKEVQHEDIQNQLVKVQNQLSIVEEEKCRALDELAEMKKVAHDANMKLCEAHLQLKQAQEKLEMDRLRTHELEQASIESAKKRDQAWQLELDLANKRHESIEDSLFQATNEVYRLNEALSLSVKEKFIAQKQVEDAKDDAITKGKQIEYLLSEINSLKDLFKSIDGESNGLNMSSMIETIKRELDKSKSLEVELLEKESLVERLKLELNDVKESKSEAIDSLSESRGKIEALKIQVERVNEMENKTFESLLCQTKQLEETVISLEEAKLEISFLKQKIQSLETLFVENNTNVDEFQATEEDELLSKIECGALALLDASSSVETINHLQNELKLALEAEEKSKKAMDDLALVLKEITTESNEVKKKLALAQSELEKSRVEVKQLEELLKKNKMKFQSEIDEARREIKDLQESADKMKLEAEELCATRDVKELEYLKRIKIAEEESAIIKEECLKLMESFSAAKDDNKKLRDILKLAIKDANVANEASEIAKSDNAQLKAMLLEKEHELQRIIKENELLQLQTKEMERKSEMKALTSLVLENRKNIHHHDAFDRTDGYHLDEIDNDKTSPTAHRKTLALIKKFGNVLRKKNHQT